jgi:site-specific DNA-cytosine methylase
MICESLFSGTLSELYGDRAMGIDSHIQAACDKKACARRFMVRNHAGKVSHVYKDAEVMLSDVNRGPCEICSGPRCEAVLSRPDFVRMGMPCQAYSRARSRKQLGSNRQGDPRDHVLWSTCFETTLKYLEVRRPRGFLVEEVLGFGDTDSVTGERYIVMFQEAAADLGYATRSFVLKAGIWSEVQRDRYYIFGVGEELGHAKAADWMAEKVDEVTAYRTMFKPTPIFDSQDGVGGILRFDERCKELRSQSKACSCQSLPCFALRHP